MVGRVHRLSNKQFPAGADEPGERHQVPLPHGGYIDAGKVPTFFPEPYGQNPEDGAVPFRSVQGTVRNETLPIIRLN